MFTPQHPTADETPSLNDGKPVKRTPGKLTLSPELLAQVRNRAAVRKQVSPLATDGNTSTINYDEKMLVNFNGEMS